MKIKMLSLSFLLGACVGFMSCGNTQNKKTESVVVGNDKDEHGCIASAGYVWSEVKQDCIRLWEEGVRMESLSNKENIAYLIFSADSTHVELFFSDDQPHVILDRRSLPAGGYAWSMEDDDTKNVRFEDGKWTISQRGNRIYKEVESLK